jgi:uncharacterized protein YdiU (UPF0061 family)
LSRISKENNPFDLMKITNPQVIPRNHRLDQALIKAQMNDLSSFDELLMAIQTPYALPANSDLLQPGPTNEKFVTYCGT